MRVKVTSDGDRFSVTNAETGEELHARRVEFRAAVGEIPRAEVVVVDAEADFECEAEIISGLERYVVRDGEVPLFVAATFNGCLSEHGRQRLQASLDAASVKIGVPFLLVDGGIKLELMKSPVHKQQAVRLVKEGELDEERFAALKEAWSENQEVRSE